MQKKAQGLPLNTIVLAALAVLVLVILAVVFISRISNAGKGMDECISKGGQCRPVDQFTGDSPCITGQETSYGLWKCEDSNSGQPQVCCIKAG